MHALGHIAANVSFAAVAISLSHTVKTLEPAFNCTLSWLITGQATPLPVILTLVPIIVGASDCKRDRDGRVRCVGWRSYGFGGGVVVQLARFLERHGFEFDLWLPSCLGKEVDLPLPDTLKEKTCLRGVEPFRPFRTWTGQLCMLTPHSFPFSFVCPWGSSWKDLF